MPAAALTPNPLVKSGNPTGSNPPQLQSQQNANQGYGQLQDWFAQNYPLGQVTQAQTQVQSLQGQIPGIIAGYQTQQQQTSQEAGIEQGQLGLQGQQYGIQAGALARQQQLLPEQYGIQQQQYGITQGALQRQQQLDPKLQALTEQQYGQQYKDIQANTRQQAQGLESAGVAGGGLFSRGQASQRGYLAEQHKSALSGLATSKKSEELGYREQLKSLQDQFKGLGLQKVGSAISFQEQMASLQDQKKNLGILQQQLGLSSEEITNRTQQALAQLGISEGVDVGQAYAAMAQVNQGEVTGPVAYLGSQLLSALKTGSAKAIP